MSVEDAIRTRIDQLLLQSDSLSVSNEDGQARSTQQRHDCCAWLVSAQHAIHLICESYQFIPRKAQHAVGRLFDSRNARILYECRRGDVMPTSSLQKMFLIDAGFRVRFTHL
jgi:hypothetical protein